MHYPILTLTLTLKIVYLDTTDILHLNYYVQHIGNKKNIILVVPRRPYKNIWMSISHDHLRKKTNEELSITGIQIEFEINWIIKYPMTAKIN